MSVEAAISMGWERWADEHVSIERFGASAPGPEVLEKLGFTPSHVAEVVRDLLDDLDQGDDFVTSLARGRRATTGARAAAPRPREPRPRRGSRPARAPRR